MAKRKKTRRLFLKETAAALTTTISAEKLSGAPQAATAAPQPREVVAALGDAIIPTDGAQYPGYKRLEAHGISTQVLNGLRRLDRVTPADLTLFNNSAKALLGKSFLELDEAGRASYLESLFGAETKAATALDPSTLESVRKVLKLARDRILTVFYRNFPYDHVDRDENGAPIPNQPHEIFDLKRAELVTGWDIAGYRGPLSWDEEESRRNRFKKIQWSEEG